MCANTCYAPENGISFECSCEICTSSELAFEAPKMEWKDGLLVSNKSLNRAVRSTFVEYPWSTKNQNSEMAGSISSALKICRLTYYSEGSVSVHAFVLGESATPTLIKLRDNCRPCVQDISRTYWTRFRTTRHDHHWLWSGFDKPIPGPQYKWSIPEIGFVK